MLSETELYDVLDAKLSYERLMRKLDDASNRIAVMRGIVLARSPAPAPRTGTGTAGGHARSGSRAASVGGGAQGGG